MKQVIVARKDLNMSPGKLAAQVAHGSIAFLSQLIRNNSKKKDDTLAYVYGIDTPYARGEAYMNTLTDRDGVILYRNKDMYKLARQAHDRGERIFHYRKDSNSEVVECGPQPYYSITFPIDAETMEDWLMGAFTKVILQVKSREKFFSIATTARERGMEEGKDFFIIRDNCLTELTPEDDGRTPTVIGFRPMRDEDIDPITGRLQLWRG